MWGWVDGLCTNTIKQNDFADALKTLPKRIGLHQIASSLFP